MKLSILKIYNSYYDYPIFAQRVATTVLVGFAFGSL